MLVNNPMGSRRRRRFYHRAGVVPIPGSYKEDYTDPSFYKYVPEPPAEENESSDGGDDMAPKAVEDKPSVGYISVTSLHCRLLEIIDSVIALAEAEDKEKENENVNGKTSADFLSLAANQAIAHTSAEVMAKEAALFTAASQAASKSNKKIFKAQMDLY